MRVVHFISGGDTGGAKTHVLSLVERLSQEIPVLLVCLTPGEFYREAVERGLPVVLIQQERRWDLSVVAKLQSIIQDFGAELLHCHGARANFVAALLKRRIGIPLLTTIHSDYRRDFEDNLYKHLVYTGLNTLSLRRFDHYLAVTDAFRELLVQRGFRADSVQTVYNGLDFSPVEPLGGASFRQQHQIPSNVPLIGIVARLTGLKRHDVLLEAIPRVHEQVPHAHFVLVGEGDQEARIRARIRDLNLADRVHLTGYLEDVEPAWAAMDINVLISESESFPYALLEGARHRLPTIATPVGGIPELILEDETGQWVPPGDAPALAGAILQFLLHPDRAQKMGNALFDFAARHFSLEAMKERHLTIYRKILAPTITVSGYFGYGNTGDEALLEGLIRGLRQKEPHLHITVLSKVPADTARSHQVTACHRFSVLEVIAVLRKSRLLISGGGTLLQDETSLRSLLYYCSVIFLAKALRCKVMIYANGLGPLNSRIGKRLAREALQRADAITLRDHQSLETARSLWGSRPLPPVEVTADPAFLLEPKPSPEVDTLMAESHIPPDARIAILSLRPWGEYTDRVIEIAAQAAEIFSSEGYVPFFVAMQPKRDYEVCEAAARRANVPTSRVYASTDASVTLTLLARADLVLGMRLHALILAAAVGVIPIGLSYDPKIEGFLSEVGAPCLGHVTQLESEELTQRLRDDILPQLGTYRDCVRTSLQNLQAGAEKNSTIALSLLR